MQIPFGEWLPDQPEYNNPGANTANNVYFAASSYSSKKVFKTAQETRLSI